MDSTTHLPCDDRRLGMSMTHRALLLSLGYLLLIRASPILAEDAPLPGDQNSAAVAAEEGQRQRRTFGLIVAGYGSRGYEPNVNGERSRHVHIGLSLNLSEVLRQTAYRGNTEPSRTQRFTETVFKFVQVPGTVALSDHRLGQ